MNPNAQYMSSGDFLNLLHNQCYESVVHGQSDRQQASCRQWENIPQPSEASNILRNIRHIKFFDADGIIEDMQETIVNGEAVYCCHKNVTLNL